MKGQQSFELFDGFSILDVGQCVFQPCESINLVLLTGFDEGIEDSTCFGARFVAMKEPVFSSDDERFNGALCSVVIYFETAIVKVSFERNQCVNR
nr:hypothetical protein [Legionella israelensis]